MGPDLAGRLKVRGSSSIWGSPLTSREISWDIRQLQLRGSSSNPKWKQAGQSESDTDGLCHSPKSPSLKLLSTSAQRGWVLECVWRADPREGLLLLATRDMPEWMEVRSSSTRNAHGGT